MSGSRNAMGQGSDLSVLMTGEGAEWSTDNRYSEEAESLGVEAS